MPDESNPSLMNASQSQGQQGQQGAGSPPPGTPPPGEGAQQKSSQQSSGDWRANIPEAIRGEKMWDKHKDIGSALTSLHQLEKKLGSSISPINDKSTPEEVSAFYEKLGVPKEAKDYKITEPKLPEGLSWDKDGIGKFTEVAHKLHLTPAQVQGVLDYYGESLGSKFQSVVEAHSKGSSELKKEWGDSFDERLSESHAALASYDPKGEFKALMKEIGADNDPRLIRFLQRIGSETGEHKAINGEKQETMTKEEAIKKAEEFEKADRSHPLHNKKDPKHADAVREYGEVLKLATS